MSEGLLRSIGDVADALRLPVVEINLMHRATAENDPFYDRIVREFYDSTQKPHPKLRVVKDFQIGMALCQLPGDFEAYLKMIEASARRNYKKAARMGYQFAPIRCDDHLLDIGEIRRSAEIRQGKMPDQFLGAELKPCANPESRTRLHDYPYFGVMKDGKLTAYTGCLVAGEIFMIEQMFGHAAHQPDGVVPLLIIGMAGYMLGSYPNVRYYAYGTYFGAGASMRRFKKKFMFLPHRVKWMLG